MHGQSWALQGVVEVPRIFLRQAWAQIPRRSAFNLEEKESIDIARKLFSGNDCCRTWSRLPRGICGLATGMSLSQSDAF